MKIGILKEPSFDNRIAMLPESTLALNKLKVEFLIEKDAGLNAYQSNELFESDKTKIADKNTILSECDVILQINPISKEDIQKVEGNKVLISVFNPFESKELVGLMVEKKLTSFSMDLVPRTTRGQAMDILSSMATVAGYKAVLDAAGQFSRFFPMFMSAAGTIKPAKVLILGAGVAGLQAISIARKLGAVVEVFDVRSAVKEQVESLGGKFVEVEGATEDLAAGGYAVEQSEDFKKRQAQAIQDKAIASDIVITTAQIPGKKAPVLIQEDTIGKMLPGSVIVDLAASTGGNCALTKNDETIIYNGVKIIGQSNYPSQMPLDASRMFGRNLVNFIKLLIDEQGNLNLDFEDELVAGTCLTHGGEIKNERVKQAQ